MWLWHSLEAIYMPKGQMVETGQMLSLPEQKADVHSGLAQYFSSQQLLWLEVPSQIRSAYGTEEEKFQVFMPFWYHFTHKKGSHRLRFHILAVVSSCI